MADEKKLIINRGEKFKLFVKDKIDKTDIFYEQYVSAARMLDDILAKHDDNSDTWCNIEYENNIIAFCGERGEGKSSAMISFVKAAYEHQHCRYDESYIFKDCKNAENTNFTEPIVIEPSMLDGVHNVLDMLLQCKTMEDITGKDGLVQKIIKDAVEHILGQELEDYISKKNSSGDKVLRNGSTTKNIKTAYGNIGVRVPRTREPGFEPEVVKKRAVIDEGLEPQITSMYAKGMSVRDIAEHLQALYGIELSATSISNITDKVMKENK